MPFHVKDGDTWKEITAPSVRDGGTWKAITEGWVRDGGTWKQFFGALTIALTPGTISAVNPLGNAVAGIRFNVAGVLQHLRNTTYSNVTGEWATATVDGADYEVYATLGTSSGVNSSTGTFGSWLNLGTAREWTITRSSVGVATRDITFQIRPAGGGDVLASATITLDVERA